jgi:hypothetical protein
MCFLNSVRILVAGRRQILDNKADINHLREEVHVQAHVTSNLAADMSKRCENEPRKKNTCNTSWTQDTVRCQHCMKTS